MRGRECVWNATTNLLRSGQAGRPGVLLIDGEAGTGKSLLIEKAARTAAAWGFWPATGAAREFGEAEPLEPLLSALGGLAVIGDVGPGRWPGRQPWIVEEIRSALERRGGDGPVLVSLDDLQWADPATLTAIQALAWQLASYPVVWLLARCTSVRARDSGRLFDLLERDGAVRFTLPPLDETALREVVIDTFGAVPDPDLLALASETGGNPALLTELLSGLWDEGAIQITDGYARLVAPRIPERIQADVRHRLDRLALATRHLLDITAIIGRSFSPEDAAEVLGTTPAALLPQFDEALSGGFLLAASDELAFRNGLLWRVIADAVPAPIRRALHRQIGDLLIRRGGTAVSSAASHLIRGARAGDAGALASLDRAIAELLPVSPRAAAGLAEHALRLTDPAEPAWPARTVTAARTLTAAGRLEEAVDLVDSALTMPVPGDSSVRLRCLRSGILRLTGRTAEAVTEATAVLAEQGVSGELRDEADLALLNAQAGAGDDAGAREHAERIVATADGHCDALFTGALITLALSEWDSGRLTEGLRLARRAVRQAKSMDARRLHPRMILAMLLTDVRRLDEARAVMRSAGEDAEMAGHLAWATAPAVLRARLHLVAGRFDDAIAEAEAGLAATSELGPHVLTSSALSVLATAALRTGDLNAARRYAQAERPALSCYGSPYAEARFVLVRAQVTVAREGPAAAAETVRRLCDELATHSWTLLGEPTAAPWLVRTALALGDRTRAEKVVAAMERLADDHPVFADVGVSATHARGLLDRDRAALERAAAEHADPWARASAAEDLGASTGDEGPALRRDAIAGLDAALSGYSELGAARDAARVRRRLRRLGIRRRHWNRADRPLSGWASLTDTERSVSALVAQGLTNRQVADQLFMSVHTVAFHLRHIFRKLEVTSRVELTRLVLEARA